MASRGYYGQSVERGSSMEIGTTPYASFGSVYGPSGGHSPSEAASQVKPQGLTGQIFGLEIPVFIALAVLTWWVMKNLDD